MFIKWSKAFKFHLYILHAIEQTQDTSCVKIRCTQSTQVYASFSHSPHFSYAKAKSPRSSLTKNIFRQQTMTNMWCSLCSPIHGFGSATTFDNILPSALSTTVDSLSLTIKHNRSCLLLNFRFSNTFDSISFYKKWQ